MDLSLSEKAAWVIGASSGMGRAIAAELLREGARVTISSRPGEKLDRAAAALSKIGAVRALPLDLRDTDVIARIAAEAGREMKGLDIAILSGGGPPPSGVLEIGLEGFDAAYQLLLRPAYAFLAAVAGPMRERRSGVIGFITSSGVREPIPSLPASNIMRSGVTALAKSAATELGPVGVRVLCFSPGRIATERVEFLDQRRAESRGVDRAQVQAENERSIPLQRYGTPEEFARTVAFACSPAGAYLTGTSILIDGGKAQGLLS